MPLDENVNVRLDSGIIARIEAQRSTMGAEWREATQADAMRAIILAGLRVLEKKRAKPGKDGP